MIEAAAEWIQNLPMSQEIAWSGWMFPTIEAIHVIGIALVFGVIAIVDLRLLGVASKSRRVTEVARDCLHWTWLGFAIAVVTGGLMFMSNATGYVTNTFFLWKMLLLVLAGINMLVFELITARTVARWDDGSVAVPTAGKAAGLLSLAFWFGVIAMGRWIGFAAYDIPI
ncbi:hypothetical protein NO932_01995 [Pelagibacterium sp. 26DY04]|uniref:DUF6644 family protein n=1 Tax=unclassified Pelagibacterium TaxID=2623280 RepID=UPI002815F41E|nr:MULTISPECIES: DUF6644 family protein [unclassified Pelagibacterium]WMT87402.1 hypothetical protein NO932_01995 [Pelagibacterium sp. 26DY04]WMT91794.1 hypothetical protein NO934_05900 [Pelagibacterium sp. H642]